MRKGKRANTTLNAWLFALALPAAALFLLFSLVPYGRMVERWPWGISKDEVMAYQFLFDHRPGQHVQGKAELWSLAPTGAEGVVVKVGDKSDSATVKELAAGGIRLDFVGGRPFLGSPSIILMPATLGALQAKYAQAVADSLPIISPSLDVVMVERDGRAPAPFLQQPRIVQGALQERGLPLAVLLTPGGGSPGIGDASDAPMDTISGGSALRADRFDTAAVAALGLLACAEQRHDLLQGAAGTAYDPVNGYITPLYGMPVPTDTVGGRLRDVYANVFNARSTQDRVVRMGAALRADSAAWAARFLAIDSAWVPILAQGRNIGLVQAEVDRVRLSFMQRLFRPDPSTFIGPATPDKVIPGPALDPWLAQYRDQRDTLRFVRGKYEIDHDMVIPEGMALVLEKGTRWNMAPGVSVVVHGELHIRGTDLNPVFIRPIDEARPYGCIAMAGDGATRCRVRGLRMSGGSGAWDAGVRFGGMLTFHGAELHMENCELDGSLGEASMAIGHSAVVMNDVRFSGAARSFLAMADVRGTVDGCVFSAPLEGGRADQRSGVRLRSSHILLRNCSFTGLPFTALRLGEVSEVFATACTFTGNSIAVRATDGSRMAAEDCKFADNRTVLQLRGNDPLRGGATVTVAGGGMGANDHLQDVDAASRVDTASSVDPQFRRSFNLSR